ncbi:structural maintenance of chromosomes protein 2-2-like [Magnolia sinica]|uniref:structural maintenance of chromosomes protein 2-2-like n=1 Tax=Magnolia sinica TaxID=86752 RepID=UPI0026587127|nr:structural maintenance of chromosomes protein 2-2-like [Magnolia sinica]
MMNASLFITYFSEIYISELLIASANLLGNIISKYNDLLSKKNIIENDKSKIKKVIEELDEKKKETLKVTWVKVNKDFGPIFSTLLPGTMAKLELPKGGSFLNGLEELIEIKSNAMRLVSHLAQISSSAVQFREVLLAMLVTRKQQLQVHIDGSSSSTFKVIHGVDLKLWLIC